MYGDYHPYWGCHGGTKSVSDANLPFPTLAIACKTAKFRPLQAEIDTVLAHSYTAPLVYRKPIVFPGKISLFCGDVNMPKMLTKPEK
jgi:hypothetical protein